MIESTFPIVNIFSVFSFFKELVSFITETQVFRIPFWSNVNLSRFAVEKKKIENWTHLGLVRKGLQWSTIGKGWSNISTAPWHCTCQNPCRTCDKRHRACFHVFFCVLTRAHFNPLSTLAVFFLIQRKNIARFFLYLSTTYAPFTKPKTTQKTYAHTHTHSHGRLNDPVV